MRPLRAPLDMEAGRSVGLPALLIALGVVLFLMMPAAASQDKENRVIAVNQIMRSAGPNIVPTMSAEDRLAATGLPPQALPTIDRSTGQTVYIFDKKPPGNYTIVLPYTFASGGVFNSAADVVLGPDQRVLSADGNIDVKNNFTSDYHERPLLPASVPGVLRSFRWQGVVVISMSMNLHACRRFAAQ